MLAPGYVSSMLGDEERRDEATTPFFPSAADGGGNSSRCSRAAGSSPAASSIGVRTGDYDDQQHLGADVARVRAERVVSRRGGQSGSLAGLEVVGTAARLMAAAVDLPGRDRAGGRLQRALPCPHGAGGAIPQLGQLSLLDHHHDVHGRLRGHHIHLRLERLFSMLVCSRRHRPVRGYSCRSRSSSMSSPGWIGGKRCERRAGCRRAWRDTSSWSGSTSSATWSGSDTLSETDGGARGRCGSRDEARRGLPSDGGTARLTGHLPQGRVNRTYGGLAASGLIPTSRSHFQVDKDVVIAVTARRRPRWMFWARRSRPRAPARPTLGRERGSRLYRTPT